MQAGEGQPSCGPCGTASPGAVATAHSTRQEPASAGGGDGGTNKRSAHRHDPAPEDASCIRGLRIGPVELIYALLAVLSGDTGWRVGAVTMCGRATACPGSYELRLGMSEREAVATGEALDVDPKSRGTASCRSQEINGVTIHLSRDHGIVGLAGRLERTRTAEGIGAEATVADITAVYPTLAHPFIFAAFEFEISGSTARSKTTEADRACQVHPANTG